MKNNLYYVSHETNNEIINHLTEWTKFFDPALLQDIEYGINFLYDFGLISLSQWAELRNKYFID